MQIITLILSIVFIASPSIVVVGLVELAFWKRDPGEQAKHDAFAILLQESADEHKKYMKNVLTAFSKKLYSWL